MHRTKCTEIIRGVLAPYFLQRVTSDVGDEKFSLLLDESADQYLGVVIWYFSAKKKNRCVHISRAG